MVRRPPNSDPTSEEDALEFSGTPIENYRQRIVAASKSAHGTVAFDDRGAAHWKWRTDQTPTDYSGTFNLIKALENPALSLEKEPAAPEPERPTKAGYNPYASGVPKPKIRR